MSTVSTVICGLMSAMKCADFSMASYVMLAEDSFSHSSPGRVEAILCTITSPFFQSIFLNTVFTP